MLSMPIGIPSREGMDEAALASFLRKFFAHEYTHGIVVMRHGKVVAEAYRHPCGPADRHRLFSLSKSFVSSAIGIARGEGLFDLDDRLVDFFPEFLSDKVGERMRRVTLRNLLTMSLGSSSCSVHGERYNRIHREFDNDRPWVQNILEDPLPFEPGSKFVYNSGATFLLSAVIRKASGQSLVDYLQPRLFRPLGFAPDMNWERNPDGIEFGGWGLNLSTREIAAAAQLWLHYGALSDGRQLIPEDYMRMATAKQISNGDPATPSEWTQGYGFQFWRCRHNAFRGDGASGQFAIMLPDFDAIVAGTAALNNMQAEFDTVWDDLLPAFRDGPQPSSATALADLRAAEHEPRFNMGPDGAPLDGFIRASFNATGDNPLAISGVAIEQDAGGLALAIDFADGTAEVIHGGFAEDRISALQRHSPLHVHAGYGRARWISPEVAQWTIAVPSSTAFFTIELDLGDTSRAPSLHTKTPIWFHEPWFSDLNIPLSRLFD